MLENCAPPATTKTKVSKRAQSADTLAEDLTTQRAAAANATYKTTTKQERTTRPTQARSNEVSSLISRI